MLKIAFGMMLIMMAAPAVAQQQLAPEGQSLTACVDRVVRQFARTNVVEFEVGTTARFNCAKEIAASARPLVGLHGATEADVKAIIGGMAEREARQKVRAARAGAR